MATSSAGKRSHGHDNEPIATGPSSSQLPSADATRLERPVADRDPYRATTNRSISSMLADRDPYRATANPSIASILADRDPYRATANPSIASILADRDPYRATANPSIASILADNPKSRSTHRHPAVPATGAATQPAAAESGAAPC